MEQRIAQWPSSAAFYLDGGVPEVGQRLRFDVWADAMTLLLDAEPVNFTLKARPLSHR